MVLHTSGVVFIMVHRVEKLKVFLFSQYLFQVTPSRLSNISKSEATDEILL